jgi:hypothetical protein
MRQFIIFLSFLLVVFYGIFNARNLILGPSIEIFSPPAPETETAANTIIVKGSVKNMTFLSINERPIFADTDGIFEEQLLLSPGFNIITIKARDRFKKEVQKTIKVYYRQSPAPDGAELSTTTNEN